jgi:chromosome segregation ATPase
MKRAARHVLVGRAGFGHDGRSEQRRMATIEERVAELEARMTADVGAEMRLGFDEMRKGFEQIAQRFEGVQKRFDQIDKRVEDVDRRFEQVDRRFEQVEYRLGRLEDRVERLDDKADRHFMWVVGIQFTTMLIFIAALTAAVLRGV